MKEGQKQIGSYKRVWKILGKIGLKLYVNHLRKE